MSRRIIHKKRNKEKKVDKKMVRRIVKVEKEEEYHKNYDREKK